MLWVGISQERGTGLRSQLTPCSVCCPRWLRAPSTRVAQRPHGERAAVKWSWGKLKFSGWVLIKLAFSRCFLESFSMEEDRKLLGLGSVPPVSPEQSRVPWLKVLLSHWLLLQKNSSLLWSDLLCLKVKPSPAPYQDCI